MNPSPQEEGFAHTLALPAAERAAPIERECANNAALRAQWVTLPRAHEETEKIFASAAPTDATQAGRGSVSCLRAARRRVSCSGDATLSVILITALLLSGCAGVPVHDQRLVSKPNMVFNDSGAFVYGPRLNSQLEPGAADNGGAVAAGCTACR